jgi:enamine deaminase RidA (YjgF/YER057c/UK114 family)
VQNLEKSHVGLLLRPMDNVRIERIVKHRLVILFALVALLAGTVVPQTTQPTARPISPEKNTKAKPNTIIRRMNPPTLSKPNGYTQVVVATGSRVIYLAGQTVVEIDGNVVGRSDYRGQAKQALENVKAPLAAAGVGFDQVVRVDYNVLEMANASVLREVRNSYLESAFAARTLVEVKKFARDEYIV